MPRVKVQEVIEYEVDMDSTFHPPAPELGGAYVEAIKKSPNVHFIDAAYNLRLVEPDKE